MSSDSSTRTFTADVAGKPVSVNRMYGRKARGGGFYLTDAAATWETCVMADVRTQMDTDAVEEAWSVANFPLLAVSITFYGVRGDVDNYLKCTFDGLKHAIGIDDRFFSPVEAHLGERTHASGRRQPSGARIEVRIPGIQPEPTTQEEDGVHKPVDTPVVAPGSLRARDLVDPALLDRLLPPMTRVQVWPATDYGAIVVMFPPSPLAAPEHQQEEWGTFLPLAQARQLRDALNRLPELNTPDRPDRPDRPEEMEVRR